MPAATLTSVLRMELYPTDHIFMGGIGGVSMSGLARALLAQGYRVSGSDSAESETTAALRAAGATIPGPQSPDNLADATVYVYSTAITEGNPERMAAEARGLRLYHRSELLAYLTRGKQGIAVSGTHGKSTTTGMLAHVLLELGTDPTVFLGGDHPALDGGNVHIGNGPFVVFEACESDGTFVQYVGCSQVITNVEADHLDQHKTLEGVIAAFEAFARVSDPEGCIVYNADDPLATRVSASSPARRIGFSLKGPADIYATGIIHAERHTTFTCHARDHEPCTVNLSVVGDHNVADALAALGCVAGAGLDLASACAALSSFTSVGRRFEEILRTEDLWIVDDYAHHPTELRATLAAARAQHSGRIVAIFQPHLRSRTRDFLSDFGRAFHDADVVVLTDVYHPRDDGTAGFDIALLEEQVRANEPDKQIVLVPDKARIAAEVAPWLAPGDLVLTLGAGDIFRVAHELAALV